MPTRRDKMPPAREYLWAGRRAGDERDRKATDRDARARGGATCLVCGRRHAVDYLCPDLLVPEPRVTSGNGPYRGTAPVRHVPIGVTGEELTRRTERRAEPRRHTLAARGQVWRGSSGALFTVTDFEAGDIVVLRGSARVVRVARKSLECSGRWAFVREAS